jgi:hypothetical protein
VTRVLRLTPRYQRDADRLSVAPASARGRAVGRTLAALMTATELPGPGDVRVLIPPTRDALVRRVPDRNLWIWYRERDGEVLVLALTADPPVPVDE